MANLRKDNPNRAAQRKSWLATPPAIIKKPLQFVVSQDSTVTVKNGVMHRELGPEARLALILASKGDGVGVKARARHFLQR